VRRLEIHMKTDHQIKQDVIAELEWDPAINSNAIGIAVNDGVVTVSGHIDTYARSGSSRRRCGGSTA